MQDRYSNNSGRFDRFGFETPFAAQGLASPDLDLELELSDQGLSAWGSPLSERDDREALAWLDIEHSEADTPLFEDEGPEPARPSGGTAKPLLGGKLWSSRDPKLGIRQAIFVSPAALGQSRAEILFYVHGLLSPCGGRPRGGMASFISEPKFALGASVVGGGRPTVLIVPQFQDAGDASWATRGLAAPAALNAYLERRLAEVGKMLGSAPPAVSDLIVAGHSKAYEVLYRLAQSHASPAMAQGPLNCLSALWLLDASYGRFPHDAMAALLAAKPGLSVKQVYRAGSKTDKFGGKRSEGRLAFIPVPAEIRHCAIPARCLPDLCAMRPVSASIASQAKEDSYAHDFAAEAEDEDLFELEDPEAYAAEWPERFDEDEHDENAWEGFDHGAMSSENEDEAERRCSHDEALFEGIEPFAESENWSSSTDQIAFRERVLAAHIKQTEKRKGQRAQPDLPDDQLGTIPGTKIKTRKDTAAAAGLLLSVANAALAAAQASGDADALKLRSISVTSGYRSGTRQLNLWRRVFSAKGGYYDKTEAKRQSLPGGPHSDAAIAYLLRRKDSGGFGIGGRIAAPGFSNHQGGIALDFLVNLQNGGTIKLDSQDKYRAIWRRSWFHKWMKQNAAKYGFQPIPTEEWHWEYRPASAPKLEAFGEDSEHDYAFEAEDGYAFGEDYNPDNETEDYEGFDNYSDEHEEEEQDEAVNFFDLAPEPYQIRGGLYTPKAKAYAAKHPAGLLRTSTVIGRQESNLVNRGPTPILIGKELTRFDGGKLGVWIADYNGFTFDFEEVLRAMGRLRDLLSAGSPEGPTEMSAQQKLTFKPTDDTQASSAKKQAYTEWRQAQQIYAGLVAEVSRTAREVGLARKDFWQAQGRLSRSIAVAKKLDKPAFEAIDFKLSDIVSIATAGSVASATVTGFALLADWLFEVRQKRAEYDRKLKEFAQTVKDTNAAVRDDLETFQNTGERYWMQVKLHRETIDKRDKSRVAARKKAALFGQSLASVSEKRGAVLAAIRMPSQVADAWRTLAITGPRALKALESLKGRWSILDGAIFHFKKSKPDPFGLEDITQIVLAARRAESWKGVLTKDDVEEWVAMSGLWDEAYSKFFV